MDLEATEGRVVTFYSYKGGTGRSMAMANVSWLLALSGYKVLVIDWDLEAPGLHRYFRPFLDDADLAESDGLIDFVIHFAEAASEQTEQADANWYKPYSNLLPYAKELNYDFPGEGTLDFIAAGRQDNAYAVRVNSFNWKHFYEKLNGGKVLDEARRILKEEYDFVLIDSRTGVSDTAGICTVQMPDDLVVCFTLNLQSVMGASAAAASVIEQRAQKANPIRVFPVPTRVEPNEKLKTATMKTFAKPKFVNLLPAEFTDDERDKYWAESDVPYIPFYAFEENLAYFRDEPNSLNSVLTAMTRIASRLTAVELRDLPRLDPERQEKTIAAYDAFSGQGIAAADTQKSKTPVYLSVKTDFLSRPLQISNVEVLTRERFEKARAATFIVGIGAGGVTSSQLQDLALAERLRIGPIYTLLLPGAKPEQQPRSLLPYPVIGMDADGAIDLPHPEDAGGLEHLPVTPYLGLNPFTAADGAFFIARGALTARLMEAVTSSKLVVLIGPPHSGRTSLVQAGLAPRLIEAGWDVNGLWFASESQASVRRLFVGDVQEFAAAAIPVMPESTCLLLIAETSEQAGFCEQRLGVKATRIEMLPLTDEELVSAIREPAMRAGLWLENGLAERIVADLKSEKAQLPLLQYIMSEVYSAEPRGALSLEKYERIGGVNLVEHKCESVFAGASLSALSRLVSLAENGSLAIREALEVNLSFDDRKSLDSLIGAGILTREGASLRFTNRIFLDRWPRLRKSVEENRLFLLWRQRLNLSLAASQANPRSFTLLSGEALVEAQKYADSHASDLNAAELAYIQASASNAQTDVTERSETNKLEKRTYFWVAAAVLLAAVVILYFWRNSQERPASMPVATSVAAPAIEDKPLAQDQGFPEKGWCYQETASAVTVRLGLKSGYGAYCHDLQENCKLAASGSATASSCVFAGKLDLQAWGGVKPAPAGFKGSWWRHDMPNPLPAPFPPPPPIKDAAIAAAKKRLAGKDQGFPVRGFCYQEATLVSEPPQQQQQQQQFRVKAGYSAYCHDVRDSCELAASGSKTASKCVLLENIDLGTWGGIRPEYRGSWLRQDMSKPLPLPFPQPPEFQSAR